MVDGTFSRLFTSGLRPVEIGRKLVREMDAGRSVGVNGKVLAPNDFTVQLSQEDYDQFAEIHDSLSRELGEAAREHARDEHYRFMGPVRVELAAKPGIRTGSFALTAHMREGEGGTGAGSLILPDLTRVELNADVLSVGRMPDCDITIEDANVSRKHAEIRPSGDGFVVADLGSTNGTRVNGLRVDQHQLAQGDELTFGSIRIVFEAS
jgi:hypothetical protein